MKTNPNHVTPNFIHMFSRDFNSGGITVAYLIDDKVCKDTKITIGYSICSAEDRYNKAIGRELTTANLNNTDSDKHFVLTIDKFLELAKRVIDKTEICPENQKILEDVQKLIDKLNEGLKIESNSLFSNDEISRSSVNAVILLSAFDNCCEITKKHDLCNGITFNGVTLIPRVSYKHDEEDDNETFDDEEDWDNETFDDEDEDEEGYGLTEEDYEDDDDDDDDDFGLEDDKCEVKCKFSSIRECMEIYYCLYEIDVCEVLIPKFHKILLYGTREN